MSLPSFQAFLLPVLESVSDGSVHNTSQIKRYIASRLGLTSEDIGDLAAGKFQPKYANRVQKAILYLDKACFIERPRRGSIKITERGLALLMYNPPKITTDDLIQYPEFKEWANARKTTSKLTTENKTPDEMIGEAKSILSSQLESELLKKITGESSEFFEVLIEKLLLAMGFEGTEPGILKSTDYDDDWGVIGILKHEALELDKIYLHAEKRAKDVTGSAVGEFLRQQKHFGANAGIYIINTKFTSDVKKFEEDPLNKIILIDGQKLAHLMIKYNVGVEVKETIELKRIDEDFFAHKQ